MTTSDNIFQKIIDEDSSINHFKIIFIDIQNYSRRSTSTQNKIIHNFNNLIKNTLDNIHKKHFTKLKELNCPDLSKITIKIPIGDGIILAFLSKLPPTIAFDFAINICDLISKSNKQTDCKHFKSENWCDEHDHYNIRIGITEGPTIIYKDINNKYNLAGTHVNLSARLQHESPLNSFVLSAQAFNNLIDMKPSLRKKFHKIDDLKLKNMPENHAYSYKNEQTSGTANDDDYPTTTLIINKLQRRECDIKTKNNEDKFWTSFIVKSELGDTHQFEISKFPVSEQQYRIMLENSEKNGRKDFPITNISWIEAAHFCNLLSEKNNLLHYYDLRQTPEKAFALNNNGFRLPTETEWITATADRDIFDSEYLEEHSWFIRNSGGELQKTGIKKPNSFGIYDLLGNIWEWCDDWFYNDPTLKTSDYIPNEKIIKGGSFRDQAYCLSPEYKTRKPFTLKSSNIGFRVARTIISQ